MRPKWKDSRILSLGGEGWFDGPLEVTVDWFRSRPQGRTESHTYIGGLTVFTEIEGLFNIGFQMEVFA